MPELEYHIEMLPVQREFYYAKERFVAIVSSRSCGKSWIAMFCALVDLLNGKNVIFMAQTDGAFYKGAWLHLQKFLRKYNLLERWSYNTTYKTGTLDLGDNIKSHFYYASYTDGGEAARGATECSSLYLDEFCLSRPSILSSTAPCLRGKDNFGNEIVPKIRAVSTPKMTSLWQLMIVEHEKYGIRLLRSKMTENRFMTDEQRAVMASAIFDPKLRAQEIEGQILLGEDATSLINLNDFPLEVPYCSDDRVYGGLDMAHTGLRDGHCFAAVKGNKLVAFHEFGMASTLEVCAWIRRFNKAYKLFSINMDLAWSEAVHENLRYEVTCTQVAFEERAPTEEARREYANIRAYGYFKLAKLHKNGLCVDLESEWIDPGIVAEYKREIVNTHFLMDRMGRLLIEPKDDIKARLGRSPDPADALMLAALDRSDKVDAPEIKEKVYRIDEATRKRYASFMG